MSRQVTVTRTELSLTPLLLNDPTNGFYVSDEWAPGGVVWERYESTASPFAHGSTVIAQRKTNVEEVFTIYLLATSQVNYNARVQSLRAAFSQFRYTVSIEWDGITRTFEAVGAGDIRFAEDKIDPILSKAGWNKFQITFPRKPE